MQKKHVAGFCEPGPSHIQNMAAVGRELQRRGHRFTLFHIPELEARVLKEDVAFWPLRGNTGNRDSDLPPNEEEIPYPVESKQEGHSVKNFLSFAKESARLVCEVGPGALRAAQVDGVLADMAQPGAATVAEHLGLPHVTICHALPLHRDATIPPDFLAWAYNRRWWARWRNVMAYRFRDAMIRPLNQVLNQYRKRWGLRAYRRPEDSFSPFAQMTQLVREFDFPRTLPKWFHYVGPYRRTCRDEISFPFERLDGRPLIYASMGTSQGDRSDIWAAIAKGCAGLDLQLVISLGGAARTREIAELPGNPIVVDYAPQMELLACASGVITHAGLNTVMETLTTGVPMIAVPITGDQFGVAARITYHGVGRVISLANFRASIVRTAITEVLSGPSYRLRAGEIRAAIENTRGAAAAAEIAEEVFLTGQPVVF